MRAFDSDSAYHLRRARFAAAEFPRTILFDPLMNFPEGGVPIWPPLYDVALSLPARLAEGPGASAEERGAARGVGPGRAGRRGDPARRPARPAARRRRRPAPPRRRFSRSAPPTFSGRSTATSISTPRNRSADCSRSCCFSRAAKPPTPPNNALREAAAGLALALAVLVWQGGIYWGAIFALALAVEAVATSRDRVLRAAVLTLGLPAASRGRRDGGLARVAAAAADLCLVWLFSAPLPRGALRRDGPDRGARSARARRDRGVARSSPRSAVVALAAAATLPFASELFAGLRNGVGYVAGSTQEVAGEGGYISYPKDWLKGIFEARPLFADGPVLAWKQLSAAIFLSPLAVLAWAVRARRGERPGVHGALAIWGAVTIFLALSQRLNVYYAAPLCALTLVEAARFIASRLGARRRSPREASRRRRRLRGGPRPRASRCRRASRRSSRAATSRARTSSRRSTGCGRAFLTRSTPTTRGLLGPPPFPESLSRAPSVLAPWSLGHFLLYEAELPVVANNFGYGFLDSIRFFLAGTEEEALAIARRHRARWVVATDLVPRMNDYASYLGRPPLFQRTPQGPVPTAAYFSTMQSRLYDFGGRGAALTGLTIEPLANFRLVHRSKSAIPRGDRWVPRWAVFEIREP